MWWLLLTVPTLINANENLCPMGKYQSSDACEACPPGQYSQATGVLVYTSLLKSDIKTCTDFVDGWVAEILATLRQLLWRARSLRIHATILGAIATECV